MALTSAIPVENPQRGERDEPDVGKDDSTVSENSAENIVNEDTLLAAGVENSIPVSEPVKPETETTVEQRDPVIEAQEGIAVPGIYCIEKGDTLAKISTKFYGDESMIDKICQANNIADKNTIQYGVNIVLP